VLLVQARKKVSLCLANVAAFSDVTQQGYREGVPDNYIGDYKVSSLALSTVPLNHKNQIQNM